VEADKDQEKKRAVNVATRSLERDLERLKADHATEIEQLNEKQKQELLDLKKKQWVSTNYIFDLDFILGITLFKASRAQACLLVITFIVVAWIFKKNCVLFS
jgi:hypothetical protein